ncbi:MAG TPA: molybdopterin-dependent oxidoreductase [Candidatus Binataceae bacterium]|nr:molybdopterin-dependent oxidoreductase [Candidatus Binataceae bacterium]
MSEGLSRRSFIKLAATAGAAAAIPGCEPAARQLIPYVVPDENVIPGVPSFYATVCNECPAGCGVVARVREGRAIKLEGNPADPISQGSICARGQAALQGLYNPDRLARPERRAEGGTFQTLNWEEALKQFNDRLAAAAKAGRNRVALIAAPLGPTQTKIAKMWLAAYGSERMVTYERVGGEHAARAAAKACFGRDELPIYRIDQAQALLSFDADFLGTWGSPVEYHRQYAAFRTPRRRRGQLTLARATYVGPRMSMTAAKCDEWVAAAPGSEAAIALSVLNVLVKQGWVSHDSGVDLDALRQFVADYDPATVAQKTGVPAEAITRMGESFGQAESAVALAGTDDPALHTAVFILNAVTGNIGKTVVFAEGAPAPAASSPEEVEALIKAMAGGEIDALVIAGGNPAFSMPAALKFQEALKKVGFVAWLGDMPDETAALAHLRLPTDHPLETWRDTQPRAGIHGLGQPVMARVFDTRPLGDILLASAHAGGASSQQVPWENTADAVNATWQDLAKASGAANFPEFWEKTLRDGGLFAEAKPSAVTLDKAVFQAKPQVAAAGGLVLAAFPHMFFYDGRGANKPWLQEIPEPVAQFVWDAWVQIHPETARNLGVSQNGMVELSTAAGAIALPAYVSEHVRPGVLAVPTGQGHTAYGRYANGKGANAWALLAGWEKSATVKARPTGDVRKLISPLYSADQMERGIVQTVSIDDLAKGVVPASDEPKPPQPYEFYAPFEYPKHKWGMTIDVNACTGCSACVAACYAENNLYVAGKDAIERGRIMSWIRVERYFPKEQGEGPLMYVTPMLCQQCDRAPCEPVCPVFASAHTNEGLNQQIYNRCVGTRYCNNNCPYKVRRFNWFAPEWDEPLNLQLNPDVSVRGAGVMEKCSFCIQRITHAEITALIEKRPVRDGEIQPACVQACPSKAMTFGDENDPQSAMMRRRVDNNLRRYVVFEDLNVGPNVVYLRDIYQGKGKA